MPQLPRVIITDYLTDPDIERRVLGGSAEIVCLDARDSAALSGRLFDADVLICFHGVELNASLLNEAVRCVGVVRGGVGFNNIDLEAAGELGIVVCNVPDYGTEEVADHALMLILALARRLVPAVDSMRRGEWNVGVNHGAPRMRGQTLGVIGAGRIGSALILRAKVLGMRVVFFDPYLPRGFEKTLGVERVWTLEELLPQCQFLSIHCPLTDETRHMLNSKTLSQLPRGSYLVNTARGGIVEENALLAALDRGGVLAAALDVVEREPLTDNRLRQHPNLLLTPHCAFYSVESAPEMRTKAAEESLRLLKGESPRNPVNLSLLKNARLGRR